jgi:hypothetical protein
MTTSSKSTWSLEKTDSSFDEFNELGQTLFPKESGGKLGLHPDFSFAVLSRFITSKSERNKDGTMTRKFSVCLRMYLQTKQATGRNAATVDMRFSLADLQNRLKVSDLTEWNPPFGFRTTEKCPYTIVHAVYGCADKTLCVGTLRTKGGNKEVSSVPKEVILVDDMPDGFDEKSYGEGSDALEAKAQSKSPRKKAPPIKREPKSKVSDEVLRQLPPLKTKRQAARDATKNIVTHKVKEQTRKKKAAAKGTSTASELTGTTGSEDESSTKRKNSASGSSGSLDSSSSSDSSSDDESIKAEAMHKKWKRSSSKKKHKKRKKQRKSNKHERESSKGTYNYVNNKDEGRPYRPESTAEFKPERSHSDQMIHGNNSDGRMAFGTPTGDNSPTIQNESKEAPSSGLLDNLDVNKMSNEQVEALLARLGKRVQNEPSADATKSDQKDPGNDEGERDKVGA